MTAILFLLGAFHLVADGEVPESLSRAILHRMEFKTAYLEYDCVKIATDTKLPMTSRYKTRISGEDIYWYELGDEDGVLHKDLNTGRPIFGVQRACSPRHTLRCRKSNDEWFRCDGEKDLKITTIEKSRSRFTLADPRSFGLFVQDMRDKSPAKWLEELQLANAHWRQKRADGMIEVSMTPADSTGEHPEYVWRIDPDKDDAIMEVHGYAVAADGTRTLLNTTKNDYLQIDSRWSLSKTQYFSTRIGVMETDIIHRAAYDRPEHPKTLDPDVMSIPPGVRVFDSRKPIEPGTIRRYTTTEHYLFAGQIVSDEEWKTVKTPFDEQRLRDFQKEQFDRGYGQYPIWWSTGDATLGIDGVTTNPDLWEAYVRRWIMRHSHDVVAASSRVAATSSLTAAQIESAWTVLKDCRKQSEPILRREKRKSEANEPSGASKDAEQKSVTTIGTASDNGDASRAAAKAVSPPTAEERELIKIFDALKSRLNKLLEIKQMKADEEKSR